MGSARAWDRALRAALCGGGGALMDLLYEDEFAAGGWILQVMAAAVWVDCCLLGPRLQALLALRHVLLQAKLPTDGDDLREALVEKDQTTEAYKGQLDELKQALGEALCEKPSKQAVAAASIEDKQQISKLTKEVGRASQQLSERKNKDKSTTRTMSSKLTVKCLKFLFDTTSGGRDICALIKETVDNFPGANLGILRELIDVGSETLQLPGI